MSRTHLGFTALLMALPLILYVFFNPPLIGANRFIDLKREGCCLTVHLDRPPLDCAMAFEFAERKSHRPNRYRSAIDSCPAAQLSATHPDATHAVELLGETMVSVSSEDRERAARWFTQAVPHWPWVAQRDLTVIALSAQDPRVVSAGIAYGLVHPDIEAPESSRPVAVAMLASPDTRDQLSACRYMGRLGVRTAPEADALAQLLTNRYTRECAVDTLRHAVRTGKLDGSVEALAQSDDPHTRIAALTVLLHSPTSEVAALETLADLASDDRWQVRNLAVRAIRDYDERARDVAKRLPAGPRRAAVERVLEGGPYLRY